MSYIAEKTKEIICDHLGVQNIKPGDHIIDDLGADSLDLVELTMAFEDEFNLSIPDEEIDTVLTVNDAIVLVEKLKKAA